MGYIEKNDPAKSGKPAGRKKFFAGYRFAVYPIHSRFSDIMWIVTDAEEDDEFTGGPAVVGMFGIEEAAINRAKALEEIYGEK